MVYIRRGAPADRRGEPLRFIYIRRDAPPGRRLDPYDLVYTRGDASAHFDQSIRNRRDLHTLMGAGCQLFAPNFKLPRPWCARAVGSLCLTRKVSVAHPF